MDAASPNRPMLTLTENAVRRVKSLWAADPENQGKHLRIYVEGGGCSGYQYGLVFDDRKADDHMVACAEVHVLVDQHSAPHLHGSTVDYVDSLTGGGFKISNPNARHTCGCGKSFEA